MSERSEMKLAVVGSRFFCNIEASILLKQTLQSCALQGTVTYREFGGLIIEVDHEVGRYYRELVAMATCRTRKLQRPSRGEHVTVCDSLLTDDKYLAGKVIAFYRQDGVYTNDNAYWIEVESADIEKLMAYHRFRSVKPLHMAIGYLNNRERKN